MLDNLQNDFLRSLLATPRTCPTPSVMWETGTMIMENRIIKKKLLFYHHLLHLSQGSLAWQICQVQTKLALPGLVQECKELIKIMELPNVEHCSQLQLKQAVNKAMKTKNKNDLLDIMTRKNYKKIDLEEMKLEKFELKPYIAKLDLNAARTKFAIRTKMTKAKLNYKNDPANKNSLWMCHDCQSVTEM